MKRGYFVVIFLLIFSSCSTLNQSKFVNKKNVKSLVISRYGKPNEIENDGKVEVWNYSSNNALKSNRRIIFIDENTIVSNEKYLKPIPFVFRYSIIYGLGILVGIGFIVWSFP